ncbi:MAG: hypothetical protein KBC41_03085 [Candidatus Pacebacteria bacterium]|nr:hypothetical protein [Candidatus Paceibacterota bacterium]MBP9867033.1 hypothetical protein [Candidatus Paceibacterota bacterium]
MQTVKKSFSDFLNENKQRILELCLLEGFTFSIKESVRCVTVKCTLPDGHVRFVIFDDHRIENPHGEKPHVCNQWHKAIGDPISYSMGKDLTDMSKFQKALSATAVMCLTQSEAYNDMKVQIFS